VPAGPSPFDRLRRFSKAEDGATTVEFALVLMPFLIVMMGTIEVMMAFFTATAVEAAMEQATRMVRTGQIQDDATPEQAFRDALCEHTITVRCADIRFEMVAGDSFEEVSEAPPFWEDEGDGDVDIGNSSSFVIARAAYDYHFLTPLIGQFLSGGGGDTMPIRATAVIRNEPF